MKDILAQGLFLLLLLTTVAGCSERSLWPPDIQYVLSLAGKNRSELVEVLEHYRKGDDTLKLRAAEFLIGNMPGKYGEYYEAPWNDVAAVHLRWTSSSDKQKVLDTYRLGKPARKDDLTCITADYLMTNIELAFKVWREVPWGKDIPFDIFCEQILPYRIDTEPLENWREKALTSFADVYDSFVQTDSLTSVEACEQLNMLLPRFRMDKDFPPMNFSQLMATSRGPCEAMTALAIFSSRALGIPVVRDYTTKWSNMEIGHSWNAVYDGKGSYVSFMGAETDPGKPHEGTERSKFKVFRQTFSKQLNIGAGEANIPPGLQDRYLIDVSSEYAGFADITIPMLFQPPKPTGYAYLAVLSEEGWEPIAWGTQGDSTLLFPGVGKNKLYLPFYYTDRRLTPAHYPFQVDDDGSCRFRVVDSMPGEVVLDAMNRDIRSFLDLMLHGRFEGANRPDFSDARVLCRIDEIRGGFYHTLPVDDQAEYRYIRYVSPDNGRCNTAELDFYDKNGEKLTGTAIGLMGSDKKMVRENAFDGDVTTGVNVDSLTNAWIGLDLGKPTAIGKIRFLPRTNGNNIYEGHRYRLTYWDGHRWVRLEEQTAAGHQLYYQVPVHVVFRLENLTRDTKGRYFTMENGVPKWL